MANQQKKLWLSVLLASFLFGYFCVIPAWAGTAGSSTDPLVTKSWVDNYVVKAFSSLENQLTELENKVTANRVIYLWVGSKMGEVGDSKCSLPIAPYIKNGRTMVPVRFIGEALGAKVDWNNATKTVTYTKGSRKVVLKIGSTTATVNGQTISLDISAEITQSNTMVPVRFVSEGLGATVLWHNTNKMVEIH